MRRQSARQQRARAQQQQQQQPLSPARSIALLPGNGRPDADGRTEAMVGFNEDAPPRRLTDELPSVRRPTGLTDSDRSGPDRTKRRLTFGAAGPLIVREVSFDRLD